METTLAKYIRAAETAAWHRSLEPFGHGEPGAWSMRSKLPHAVGLLLAIALGGIGLYALVKHRQTPSGVAFDWSPVFDALVMWGCGIAAALFIWAGLFATFYAQERRVQVRRMDRRHELLDLLATAVRFRAQFARLTFDAHDPARQEAAGAEFSATVRDARAFENRAKGVVATDAAISAAFSRNTVVHAVERAKHGWTGPDDWSVALDRLAQRLSFAIDAHDATGAKPHA